MNRDILIAYTRGKNDGLAQADNEIQILKKQLEHAELYISNLTANLNSDKPYSRLT